ALRRRPPARRRPLRLRRLSPARPPRRPRLHRRLLLPEQRRGGDRGTAGGRAPVGVLDLDLHYPNGTSELVERMGDDATLHSLHAAPVTNVAAGTQLP